MKRVLTTVTALLLAVVLCCSAAFASGNTYYLEEVDADIALPSWEDYYYLYPNMPVDSEDLAYLEMTPEEINAILLSNGILFDALFYDASHEIAVQVNDSDMELDYSQLSDSEQADIIAATMSELETMGYTVHAMEWMESENGVWLVTEFSLPNNGGWAYQYHTARGGKTLLFTASSATGAELTDDIRQVTAAMALGTVFHTGETLPGDVSEGVSQGDIDLGGADAELLAKALGLTEDEFMALMEGTLDFNDVDLSNVDLGAVVEAVGMTEEQAIDMIKHSLALDHVNLSGIELSKIDLGALVDAAGLTGDDLNKIARGELDANDLDLSGIDPKAMADALGLTEDELLDILLSAAGAGDLDWRGILSSAGRGALVGFGAGVVIVIIIVVLLAVIGRKKRVKNSMEEPAAEV